MEISVARKQRQARYSPQICSLTFNLVRALILPNRQEFNFVLQLSCKSLNHTYSKLNCIYLF